MATLHVRQFPGELYRRLVKLAEAERRSVSAEVTVLMERILTVPATAQADLLQQLSRQRFHPARSVPSSGALLRADRRR